MRIDWVVRSAAFCVLTVTLAASPSMAAEPPKGDPKAMRLLDEVIKTYRALPAYEDHGNVTVGVKVDGASKVEKLPQKVAYVRPDKLSIESGLARLICDGETLTVVADPLKKYTKVPAPKTVSVNTLFTAGPSGSEVLGGPGGPMMHILLNLLVGQDPARALGDLGDTLSLEKDQDLDGRKCQVIKLGSEKGVAYLMFVDAQSKLLRAIDVVSDARATDDLFPSSAKIGMERFRWSAGDVSTKTAAESRFAFSPPKEFSQVEGLTDAPSKTKDEPRFKVHEFLGKPAPNFALTVLDGEGKTKTLTKSDLSGKVVVIDFWATWCGPCLKELPEIQGLVETLSKDKKAVIVAAVSQDNDPRDPVAVRKLVETTLDKHKIALSGNPVGLVAIDPSNSVGEAFDVEGYPTVLVLDAKGVVRSVHVGFSDEVGKKLASEIDALLTGKPISDENVKPGDAGK